MERAASDDDMTAADSVRRAGWRRKRWAIALAFLALLLGAALAVWMSREQIVDDIIRDQLDANNIPASYTIDRVGGQAQVLSQVVLGDPDAPDFTAERVIVTLRHRFGVPETGAVEIVRYTVVDDFGVVVNPPIVEGQVHGGIAQGIGQVLLEHRVRLSNAKIATLGELLEDVFFITDEHGKPLSDPNVCQALQQHMSKMLDDIQ